MGEELEGEQAEQPTKIITDDPGVVAGTDVEQTQTSGVRPEYVHKRRSFRPGEVVAEHFQIVRLLGEGGMGEVFVARDTALGRRVAIKTLKLPQFASEAARARFVQLFERDAASTAQLSHSGIVTIFQFGEHQGTSFFVLELVDGQPLDDILARGGALEQREVLRLGVQLCQALSYAHSKGVIHRDIKPANLMRTRDGRLKVLDFGVALLKKAREDLEEAFGTSHAVLEQRLSEEIITAGTPPYMAPEQLQGLEQDERTDIWGVGITLFELLTGRRPRPSSPSDTEAFELVWPDGCEVSESVRAAVQGCLTYSFDARTASMHLLGAQLKAALEELIAPGVEWRGEHRKTNLVALPDAFVGRQGDLAALDALVFGGAQGGGRRLVTLVGPGGVGKTRLVTEWGLGAVEREGVHQVAFCSLTEAQTEDDVLFGLGWALGVPLTQKDPVAQLGHVFERKQGLVLILDNCEQVARQVAGLLSGWAASLAQVKVVATSRVGLEVRGEHLLPLEPLGDEQEAMALYTERARQQRPGWVCPQDQQGALRELVDQLDRLPLAIELAAARVKVLGPRKMLKRISQRFKVLKSKRSGTSDRQATLHGAIAWSWELLHAAQRSAMAQMSVFEGGFSLEAAEEVLDLSDFEQEPFVLDVVEELVHASLLRSEGDGERFKMLVSVRAFAQEQLSSSGAEHATRARHAMWFARWSYEDVQQHLGSPLLAQEVDDLEAASAWGLAPGRSAEEREWGMVCTAALATSWTLAGRYHQAGALAARVQGSPGAASEGMARALGQLGSLARLGGQAELARTSYEQALSIARQVGDLRREGICLGNLGSLEQAHGSAEQAKQLLEQALGIARQVGDLRNEGICLGNLGISEQALGRVDPGQGRVGQARQLYEQALGIARQVGDLRFEGIWLGNLGLLELEQGRMEQAKQLNERALDISRRVGDLKNEGISLGNLGNLEHDQGRTEQAQRLCEQALAIARQVGDLRREGLCLGNLGGMKRTQGRMEQARQLYEQALGIARQLGELRSEGIWLEGLGNLERTQGRVEQARLLYEQALAIARQVGDLRREGICLGHLGSLEHIQGRMEQARQLYEQALGIAEQVGDRQGEVRSRAGLGQCDVADEDQASAKAHLEACFALLTYMKSARSSKDARVVLELASALGVEPPAGIFVD